MGEVSVSSRSSIVIACAKMAESLANVYLQARDSQMVDFWNEEKYCDAVVVCNTNIYPCHRVILAASSEYFHDIFQQGTTKAEPVTIVPGHPESVMFDILIFIYTGELQFTRDNIYHVAMAANDYKLRQLLTIDVLAAEFILKQDSSIRDSVNVFPQIINLTPGRMALITALSRHIMTYFHEFSKESFVFFTGIHWNALLNQRWYLKCGMETVLLKIIASWMESRPLPTRLAYINNTALRRMNFDYSSDHYMLWLSRRFSDKSYEWQDEDWSNLEPKNLPALHVYLRDRQRYETRVYSICREFPWWRQSAVLPYCFEFMASVGVGDGLYCLAYSSRAYKFQVRTSIADSEARDLEPPLVRYKWFQLCHTKKYIYMSSFRQAESPPEGPVEYFSSQGIYEYDIELNKWSPVPPLPVAERFDGITMTTHDGRLYLIGKVSNVDANVGHDGPMIYSFDRNESPHWKALKPTTRHHDVENMTCCVHEGKVYLCSGKTMEELTVERYDLKEEKWERVAPMGEETYHVHKLLSFENWLWAVGESISDALCNIETYSADTAKWAPSPIAEAIEGDFTFMDCVIFKSY